MNSGLMAFPLSSFRRLPSFPRPPAFRPTPLCHFQSRKLILTLPVFRLMDKATDTKKYVKTTAERTPGLQPVADKLNVLYQKAVDTRRANKRAKNDQTVTK